MAGRLKPYYQDGQQDEENLLWINVNYITGLTVSLDPRSSVWQFTIFRLAGVPLTSMFDTLEEALAEADEWRFLVNSADSGGPEF